MKKAETKQKLLESTLHLMSEKGYLGATTREISRNAGVTELTLFRHFGTKEKLFVELLSSYAFLPRLKELMPELGDRTYEQALILIAVKFLTTLKERKSMMKILLSEAHIYPEKVKKMYRSYVDEVRATLAGYFVLMQKKGVLRNVSPEIAARTFLGMLFNYFRTEEIMKESGMTKKRMEQAVKDMVDIFINGTQKFN
ncbi:MAG TPA: TetR/AcrR family transcriptional regulator [Nitrospirota bacterium]|nr:TetR/AcrR family transcriptional regulator [Nitrospirota bacterium]